MLNTFIRYHYLVKVFRYFNLFHSWHESQSASVDPLFPQAGVMSLKVLPPRGAWVTEASGVLESTRSDIFERFILFENVAHCVLLNRFDVVKSVWMVLINRIKRRLNVRFTCFSKLFLAKSYVDTNAVLQTLKQWPVNLQRDLATEFANKSAFQQYIVYVQCSVDSHVRGHTTKWSPT